MSLFFASTQSNAEPIFEVIFNDPACKAYQYQTPVYPYKLIAQHLQPGSVTPRTEKTRNIYCRPTDFPETQIVASPAFARIADLMKRGAIIEVQAAFFIFDNMQFANSICEAHARKPFKMRLVLQKGGRSKSTEALEQCMGANFEISELGCNWRQAASSCHTNLVSTMHAKLMRVSYGYSELSVVIRRRSRLDIWKLTTQRSFRQACITSLSSSRAAHVTLCCSALPT